MTVTVLLPVYNAEIYLRESIQCILDQTYSDFELLIINDGSTDNSQDIIRDYKDPRIRVVKNEKNLGLIASLNKGLTLAKGKYIARQDADDISLPNRLEKELTMLEADPELLLISSNAYIINENTEIIGKSSLPFHDVELRFRFLFKCGIFHTSVIFRKETLDKFHLKYNTAYVHVEDYKLWSDISRHGKICVLPDKLVKYRVHPGSISSRFKSLQEKNAALVVQENLDHLGVRVHLREAERLRALFRTHYVDKSNLLQDIRCFLRIINQFELVYKYEPRYTHTQAAKLLQRMSRWIAKKNLYQTSTLFVYLRIKYKLYFHYKAFSNPEIKRALQELH